ncbi:hypothetical protein [Rhizobium sp. BK176]|uniref:hypothetical protein n=1 Tax=Rhizobium sp. BK176 TaxID=2587071 RepID=UPI002169A3AE|nr:hypothetical protein [Rhizobium sp. BK176]MCS4089190.1 hypothetical protein [Rhizobium sp. BK176]
MSINRTRREALDHVEMADASLRKSVFREIGRDLACSIREGLVTDISSEIARLMEKAFKAGAELGAGPSFKINQRTSNRIMTELDVPPSPREEIPLFQVALRIGFDGNRGATVPEALFLIMQPGYRGMPSSLSRDEWLFPIRFQERGFTNKVVSPLIKLGLYHDAQELSNGWKVSYMTEWGFEFFTTGQTRVSADRKPGTSSTIEAYRGLLGNDPNAVFQSAARRVGMFDKRVLEPSGRFGIMR